MIKLGLNIDHVATLRQARGGVEPDPVAAALIAETAGADSITIHLREDRRHIQDRDLCIISKTIKTRLNLEMAATPEMQNIALATKPHSVCLVPEKRQEVTTEGGLDVAGQLEHLTSYVKPLVEAGILVSMFINPCPKQIHASHKTGAQFIELHTGAYAEAYDTPNEDIEYQKLIQSAELATNLGLTVNAGHGLNYHNVKKLTSIPQFYEFNIGHAIISKAVFVGLETSVKDMLQILS